MDELKRFARVRYALRLPQIRMFAFLATELEVGWRACAYRRGRNEQSI